MGSDPIMLIQDKIEFAQSLKGSSKHKAILLCWHFQIRASSRNIDSTTMLMACDSLKSKWLGMAKSLSHWLLWKPQDVQMSPWGLKGWGISVSPSKWLASHRDILPHYHTTLIWCQECVGKANRKWKLASLEFFLMSFISQCMLPLIL